jgi:hypothetical protein
MERERNMETERKRVSDKSPPQKAWNHLDTAFDAVCLQRADHGAAPARAIGQVRALELADPLPPPSPLSSPLLVA